MEIALSVSEAELEEFPEEATESSELLEQPSGTSQGQGTVKSLLSVDTSPTANLLEKLRRGKVSYVTGNTPTGGSNGHQENEEYKVAEQPHNCNSKQPRSFVITKPIIACK